VFSLCFSKFTDIEDAGFGSSEPKSYHPILNLSAVSKLLERLVTKRLVECPRTKYDLLPEVQSTYLPCHLTETALLEVFADILTALVLATSH